MPISKEEVFGGAPPLAPIVEELEAMYPHYLPTPKDDQSVIMYRAGQRSVVEYLKAKL